jgi:hypothetical protein
MTRKLKFPKLQNTKTKTFSKFTKRNANTPLFPLVKLHTIFLENPTK